MKSNNKTKQNLFLTTQKSITKPRKIRSFPIISDNEHHKLIQYRDYLMSLRKMDLGNLILQNHQRKKLLTNNKDTQKFFQSKHEAQLNEKISVFKRELESFEVLENNPENIKAKNIKKLGWRQEQTKNCGRMEPQCFQDEIRCLEKATKKKFKLHLKKNFQEDELYCNENMQQLMKSHHSQSIQWLHISNLSKEHSYGRYYSSHQSSKCRDLSMPSIQERNISQESESSIQKNGKRSLRFISNCRNYRKYSSCNHQTSMNEKREMDLKQKFQTNQSVLFLPISRGQQNESVRKKPKRENINFTQDTNTNSRKQFPQQGKKNLFDIDISPFNIKSNIKQDFGHHKQKEVQKLCLNVGQIIKKINNRESNSSMSDRSYQKKQQNLQARIKACKKEIQ